MKQNIDWHEEFNYRRPSSRNERCQHAPQSGDRCRRNHYYKNTFSKIVLRPRHWRFAQLRSHRHLVLLWFHHCCSKLDIAVSRMVQITSIFSASPTRALGNLTAIPSYDEPLSAYIEAQYQPTGPSGLPLLEISALLDLWRSFD